jgi:hypothetical protein
MSTKLLWADLCGRSHALVTLALVSTGLLLNNRKKKIHNTAERISAVGLHSDKK